MSQQGKILVLVRHAKSSWKDANLADIDRPLNTRGRRDAPAMGRWLLGQGTLPELILASPARRARATAEHLLSELGLAPANLVEDRDLYFEGSDGMVRALERVEDRFDRVMMVGHNPVMTRLLNQLTGGDVWNMPTCAMAIIRFDMPSWGLVGSTDGELLAYQTPKELK